MAMPSPPPTVGLAVLPVDKYCNANCHPHPKLLRSLWMTPIVKPERPEAIAPVAYPEIQITETLAFDQILDKVVSNDKRPNKD